MSVIEMYAFLMHWCNTWFTERLVGEPKSFLLLQCYKTPFYNLYF